MTKTRYSKLQRDVSVTKTKTGFVAVGVDEEPTADIDEI
jgi:hypothetical protein